MLIRARILFTAISVSLLAACATGGMRVSSTPTQADVYVAYENGPANKVGQTPITLDERSVDLKRGKYVNLSIKKDGYLSETVVVPSTLLDASVDVTTRLEEAKLPNVCASQSASVEKIARGVASAQSLLNQKNIEEARGKIAGLINEYPDISVLHDLMGNVHYISKNLEAAYASYQRSLNIDPTNADTQRMVNKLRGILNVRGGSGQGGQ